MDNWLAATAAIAAYIIGQVAFSSHYFYEARKLSKKSFAGISEHGSRFNPLLRIFIAGDSLAAGVGASRFENSLAGRIAIAFAKRNHVILTNTAKSGGRMKDITVPRQKQDIAIIVASSNDLYHFTNKKRFEHSAHSALRLCSAAAKKVVLVGPGDIGGATAIPIVLKPFYNMQRPKYAAIMRKAALKYQNAAFANPMEFSMKPYGRTEAVDGFHPNDSGHKFWADIILSAIATNNSPNSKSA